MTYTVKKILELIKMYHVHIELIKNRQREYSSVGVTVYDIEATLPKSNQISDTVAEEAIRLIRDDSMFQLVESNVKYIQDRLDSVEDEEDAIVLSLRLSGYTVKEIANLHNVTSRTIHRRLEKIAMLIQGYTNDKEWIYMKYIVCVGSEESEREIYVAGVTKLEIIDGAYFLYDDNKEVVFSAPLDAVLYISFA